MSEETKLIYEKIEKHLKRAYEQIDKAKKLANDHGLKFEFKLDDGIGGTYHGKREWQSSSDCEWENSSEIEGEWISSTESCS